MKSTTVKVDLGIYSDIPQWYPLQPRSCECRPNGAWSVRHGS